MTRLSDLAPITEISPTLLTQFVTTVSNGMLTYKMAISDLKRAIIAPATRTTTGVIQVGDGLSIDDNGILAVNNYSGYTLPVATQTTLGGIKVGDGLTINNHGAVELDTTKIATRFSYGLVKVGDGLELTNGVISVPPASTLLENNSFNDDGISIGLNKTVDILIKDGNPTITTHNSGILDISIRNVFDSSTIEFVSGIIAGSYGGDSIPALMPKAGNISLGIASNPWHSIYGIDIYGNLTGIASKASTLKFGIEYLPTDDAANSKTIPIRNTSGDITANNFIGVATKSNTLKVGTSYFSSDLIGNANTIAVRDDSGAITATEFKGICTNAKRLQIDSSLVYASAVTTKTPNTIVARDSNSDITAETFRGTATTARYADLAEKYEADAEYDEGTVVIFGGEKEITMSTSLSDHRVAGVISKYPAYLMNEESPGLPVALRGKVPVKVIGLVSKGDLLVSSAIPGYAFSVGSDRKHGPAIFAKSIEDKTNHDRGMVMAVVI